MKPYSMTTVQNMIISWLVFLGAYKNSKVAGSSGLLYKLYDQNSKRCVWESFSEKRFEHKSNTSAVNSF